MKVVSHTLHPATIVADAEVTLRENAKLAVAKEFSNSIARLAVAKEFSLDHAPRLTCGLRRFPNDLVEFGGEGAEDPYHHDDVQFSLIDGWIDDVEEGDRRRRRGHGRPGRSDEA
jgi:hypothetical protein